MDELLIFITASNQDEAVKIAKELIGNKLAGCVNIIKDIRSIYRWEGKIQDDSEVLMIAKTQKHIFDSLVKKVKELHSYTVPEIIAIPIIAGSEDYLKWLKDVTD
ncbi:MAG: divalent-cation tolerance protein CutA [Nitrospirae bacterium]|nr:divalent-cation tolerance protein CutA [Nitrospirota bacterium]